MSSTIKIEWRGIDKMQKAMMPNYFKREFTKNLRPTMERIALRFRREIRERIRDKKYEENTPLTSFLKGSDTPLINKGDLWRQITYDLQNLGTMIVLGVKRRRIRGKDIGNIGAILHQGFVFKLTAESIKAIFAQMKKRLRRKVSRNGGSLLYPGKVVFVPPRPFIKEVFEDSGMIEYVRQQWTNMVRSITNGMRLTK